jgi:hypothetical protein
MSEFTNVWETAFDLTDTTFDCNVNRTNGDPSTEMFLINHFLDQIILGQPAPDPDAANVTNGVSGTGSLGLQVQTCAAANGRNPNFMLVDVRIFVCTRQGQQLTLYSSMSLAAAACSRLLPLPMALPTTPRRRYPRHSRRAQERRRLQRPYQMALCRTSASAGIWSYQQRSPLVC